MCIRDRAAARRERRLLLVYLHSPLHPACDAFCRETLCTEAVAQYIDANFLFWGADATTSREGYVTAASLQVQQLPYLALMWKEGEEVRVVAALSGNVDIDTLISRLIQANDENAALINAAAMQEDERNQSRVLLRQQDDDYEESLRRDRLRELQLQEEREIQAQAQVVLEPEPNPSEPDAIKLVFRLPNGRWERYFRESSPLVSVYNVVDAKMREHYEDATVYRLVTNYPRVVYERSSSDTLLAAGISNNTLLIYEELD